MSRNVPVSLIFLALTTGLSSLGVLTGCGDSGGGTHDDVQGIVVNSSDHAGMVVAAVNFDATIKTSRIYNYDFASGTVTEMLPGESGNPAVFAVGDKVLLFNRQGGADKTLRVLEPKSATAIPGNPITLDGLADGDPLDAASLGGDNMLLASGLGGKLQILDYAAGALTDVPMANLASVDLRPVGVQVNDKNFYVVHSGIEGLGTAAARADGTQQVYAGKINGTTLTFTDKTAGTPAIDGMPLTASNPLGMVNRGTDTATIVGLCTDEVTGCEPGSGRLSLGAVANANDYSDPFPYLFFNTIVDGPSASTVYAHVQRRSDSRYLIIKLNVETQSAVTVHEFDAGDDRLYGLAYDASSRTLFVGGTDTEGLKGKYTLYRDDQPIGSFLLDGVPYHTAFVPR